MREDRGRLRDILDAAKRIERYAKRGQRAFEDDELVHTWMIHHIQIIGEAASKLTPAFRKTHQQVPWPQIIKMRHVLIHDYLGVVSSYWPEPANFAAQQLASDTKWAFSIAAIPLGLLAATYAFGSDILSPTGGKKALLAWPEYWKLKMRIVVAIGYCLLGCALIICGIYLVAHQSPVWGGNLAIAGVLCAAAALASVALARLTIREIISE